MMPYIIQIASGVIIALLAYKIGRIKERLKNAESKAETSQTIAEIAARPHSSASALRDRMRAGDM